ncbi:hypothetical protein BDR22DRAFT_840069 [Usnea florida]
MPRAKAPKNLEVDGTAKLAAKSKPSDKHEAPNLNIEEATVASPRPSRKRRGDYFDFEDDEPNAKPSSRPVETKSAKSNKKTKTVPAAKAIKLNEAEAKPASATKSGKKGKGAKAVKEDLAEQTPESSKKSKEIAAGTKPKTNDIPNAHKAGTRSKTKKSKANNGLVEQESSAVAPDVTLDEGTSEALLESEEGQAHGTTEKKPATGLQTIKAAKAVKKPTKESKTSKIETASAADSAKSAINEAKVEAEKAKKAAKKKIPSTERAADVADDAKTTVKAGGAKIKQAANSVAPIVQTPVSVTDVVGKDIKPSAGKTKKGAKSKGPEPAKHDKSVKFAGSTEERSKPGPSKSKKRKAPESDNAELVKSDILDPLSEHASAQKKQKKANTKPKSLGDTVGEIIATASEGANVARSSLGDFATSILGGASEAAETPTDAGKIAEAAAKKADVKGKDRAEDTGESSGTIAAYDGTGDTILDENPDDDELIAGFESDGDEGFDFSPVIQRGQKIPPLPKAEATAKKLEDVKHGADEGSGVVYLGRIPHGFYEHEMREYFTQFGEIGRLRLSRSRKNGASRHYAFIEFASAGVAKIVADTMNNYLLFGHILKCKMVAKEQIHEQLWKGASGRFKVVPWNKKENAKFNEEVGKEHWTARIEAEEKRRAMKNEKTREIGYEFDARDLKSADDIPIKNKPEISGNGDGVDEEKTLVIAGGEDVNGPVVVSEQVKTKRVRKGKGKSEETSTITVAKKTKRTLDAGEETLDSAAKKAKKVKKVAA